MRLIRWLAVVGVAVVLGASGCEEGQKYHPMDGGTTAAGGAAGAPASGLGGATSATGSGGKFALGGSGGISDAGGRGGATADVGVGGSATGGSNMGGGTAMGGSTAGSGVMPSGTGGPVSSGGANGGTGPGGRAGTAGSAGRPGSGGIVGTGGAGTGTGGAMSACQPSATQCAAGNLQTCGANGQWGAATSCGAHRACTGPAGTAQCTCTTDPVCKSLGNTCSSTTALANCAMDGNGCFYQASSMTCSNGACNGNACCTNACTAGAKQSSGCGTQTCQVGTNGCLAWSTPMGSCTAPLVCERSSGPVCADPNWAEWPIPADSPNGFTDNGDGTITDNVTKLMWQKAVASGTYTQAAAVAYCPTVTTGGHNDWRLPAVIELFSIVDHTVSNGWSINAVFDKPTADEESWTSTVVAGAPSNGWAVNLYVGTSSGSDKNSKIVVRCVR